MGAASGKCLQCAVLCLPRKEQPWEDWENKGAQKKGAQKTLDKPLDPMLHELLQLLQVLAECCGSVVFAKV